MLTVRDVAIRNVTYTATMNRSIVSACRVQPPPTTNVNPALDAITHGDGMQAITLEDIYQKLEELLQEFVRHKAGKQAIRLPDVKELTGESRSQIYARMNPKYPAYDPTWPLPFYIGKSPRWWRHEVEAWLDAQAHSSATRH